MMGRSFANGIVETGVRKGKAVSGAVKHLKPGGAHGVHPLRIGIDADGANALLLRATKKAALTAADVEDGFRMRGKYKFLELSLEEKCQLGNQVQLSGSITAL